MAELAIAVIHGMGTDDPGYAGGMISELNKRIDKEGKDSTQIAWESIFWANLLQPRQLEYLRALSTCSKVDVLKGRYKKKRMTCSIRCGRRGEKRFQVPEEKRTDVNIAIHIVDDAYQDLCDRVVR